MCRFMSFGGFNLKSLKLWESKLSKGEHVEPDQNKHLVFNHEGRTAQQTNRLNVSLITLH